MQDREKAWCPAIELNETERDLILKAEIPGVEIKHLNINAESESISITGVHDRHMSAAETELVTSQLHYGQLECSMPLPETIQVNNVRAELINGVLTITMPKMSAASGITF